jgi:PAS domain S-box-containing protein
MECRARRAPATASPRRTPNPAPRRPINRLSPAAVPPRDTSPAAWSPPTDLQTLLDETCPGGSPRTISPVPARPRRQAWWRGAPPAVPVAASTPTSARSTCPAPRSRWPPTASRARRNCCPTCWSARSSCWRWACCEPAGALWRHIARRLAAEGALRQQMAFRTAMENSLLTGLRARDLEGRVTYVNPAFCRIVGLSRRGTARQEAAHALLGAGSDGRIRRRALPRCWPARSRRSSKPCSSARRRARAGAGVRGAAGRQDGRQTGWMSSILDITDRKRAEELNRQQQEKLETSARLATMGEISSMLAHELNQPLAAISSYTTGALNVLERAGGDGAAPVDCRHAQAARWNRPARRRSAPARSSAACTNSSRSANRAARRRHSAALDRRHPRADRTAGAPELM